MDMVCIETSEGVAAMKDALTGGGLVVSSGPFLVISGTASSFSFSTFYSVILPVTSFYKFFSFSI